MSRRTSRQAGSRAHLHTACLSGPSEYHASPLGCSWSLLSNCFLHGYQRYNPLQILLVRECCQWQRFRTLVIFCDGNDRFQNIVIFLRRDATTVCWLFSSVCAPGSPAFFFYGMSLAASEFLYFLTTQITPRADLHDVRQSRPSCFDSKPTMSMFRPFNVWAGCELFNKGTGEFKR